MNPQPADSAKARTPRTVADGFAEFAAKLVSPVFAGSAEADASLAIVKRQLETQYAMSHLAPYGSNAHGTHISQYSALDHIAVIPRSRLHENSGETLAEICAVLQPALPDAIVTGGRPVIEVPFGAGLSQRHHIVPAIYLGADGGHDQFSIPAPADRWVGICPGAHNVWINDLDTALNHNLKPFIRMVKAWSYFNKQPIWSYYLELSVADFLRKNAYVMYAADLRDFFEYMRQRNLAPFDRGAGCAKPVYGTSIAGKDAARAAIRDAAEFSAKACKCNERNQIADAFYWWRKMFDWRFAQF